MIHVCYRKIITDFWYVLPYLKAYFTLAVNDIDFYHLLEESIASIITCVACMPKRSLQ